jgi:hypothetical protein
MSETAEQTTEPEAPAATGPKCRSCGTPLQEGQDWCLECGTARPGRTGRRRGLLGPTLGVAGLTILLVAGAVAAAYAALAPSHNSSGSAALVAQLPTVSTATTPPPVTTTNSATIPSVPATPTPAPTPVPSTTPSLTTSTKATTTGSTTTTHTTTTTTTTTNTTTTTTTPATQPILLDPNAASNYNPFNFPASRFGDPSLAIDGDTTTSWTYQLDPSSGGLVGVGLLIDMRAPQKVGSLVLQTGTPGMAVEYYGANGSAPPASITTPDGWKHLASTPTALSKNTVTLSTGGTEYRYVLVWIRRAAVSGSPTSVGISELVLNN